MASVLARSADSMVARWDLSRVAVEAGVAVLSVLAAWGARLLLAPLLGQSVPFITFFPMMFLLAWWGGFRAALFGVILSSLVLDLAILEPIGSFRIAHPEFQIGLGIYIAVAFAAGWLGERVLAARKVAKEATKNAIAEGERLRISVANRKQAEESLTFLANASTTLAALVDRESALQQAARLPIPFLADWCVVYVVDGQGAIDYHAHAHVDPEKDVLLGEMLSRFPLDWDSNTATVRALRTGKSQLLEELPDPLLSSFTKSPEHRAIVHQLSPHAVISVPLKIRDRTIGVIGLVACDKKRRYTPREVALAESLAQRVAVAVDNARLFHAVKEASRQKDEFLAMLAHELRNPLAAIRYAVALGQMSPKDAAEEMFGIIDRQTGNLAHLIDDLLDVSRISRDKITLRRESVDVATLVEGAAATVRPLMEEKCHKLSLNLPDQQVAVFADPTRAEQIIANLLTNAAKYTNKGGQITVQFEAKGTDVVIEVSDTGIGLSSELIHRMFDLFAQADRTLDRAEGGLGIGLTVARKLAEMQGGSISAESEGLGHGSTFTVRLPLSQESNMGSDDEPSAGEIEVQTSRRVLIVDDNRDTATSCAKLFRVLGHEVETAFDGNAALAVARRFQPEAIFLDIGLPGMTGYEVVKELRSNGFAESVIVAVSGYGQLEDRERSREAGFDDHLVKPVRQEELLNVLRRIPRKPVAVS